MATKDQKNKALKDAIEVAKAGAVTFAAPEKILEAVYRTIIKLVDEQDK